MLFIVGKTSSGKDTVAQYLKRSYNLDIICSYTTRPIRESELNHREHHFITESEMNILRENERMLAYVKFQKTNYQYCALYKDVVKDNTIYIIDPDGIINFEITNPDIKFKTIYVHLNEDEIRRRAKNRGDKEELIEKRLNSERKMFDKFLLEQKYDYLLDSNQPKKSMLKDLDYIMLKINN